MSRTRLFDQAPARVFLAEELAKRGMSMSELSIAINRSHAYVQQFLKRGIPETLPADARAEIANVLRVSEERLGGMPGLPSREIVHFRGDRERPSASNDYERVSIFEYRCRGADVRGENESMTQWKLPKVYLEGMGVNLGHKLAIFMVPTDAMQPTLKEGDRVLIDADDTDLSIAGLFAIFDGDSKIVRRIERLLGTKPQKIRIAADNPAYASYEVEQKNVSVLGRAIMTVRRLYEIGMAVALLAYLARHYDPANITETLLDRIA